MKLYEICSEINDVMCQIDAHAESHEGEIPDELGQKLDSLTLIRSDKIGQIARLLKNIDGERGAIEAERKKLQNREHQLDKMHERIKSYLSAFMAPGELFSDSVSKISWRKSEAVNILDELQIPENYCENVRKIHLIDIKDAIKKGEIVPGAEIISKQNIQVK